MKLQTDEWLLSGLDGGHPLAFLAAVGSLRTASLTWPKAHPTLRWILADGAWRPVLAVREMTQKNDLLDGLDAQLKTMRNHAVLAIGDDLNFTPEVFRDFAMTAQSTIASNPIMAEFLSAFACEAVLEEKKETIADTAFRTMRGAGHQHFVKTMRDLVAATTLQHLEKCLFHSWEYADSGLSLRLDPADDRRYALRWTKPSADPARTEYGANRLAIEAIPLFPVQAIGKRLHTTGFTTRPRQGTFLTWPIWDRPISLVVLRSVLALASLQTERPARNELAAQGIVANYRCQRITMGKFRNFSSASPL